MRLASQSALLPPSGMGSGRRSARWKAATSDTESDSDKRPETQSPVTSAAPSEPWLQAFNLYIDSVDEVPKGMTTVQWWGVSLRSACLLSITNV